MELIRGHCASTYLGYPFGVTPRHPYTIFPELSLLWKELLCFCIDLAKVLLQGATTPPLHHFLIFIIVGRQNYASDST